MLECHEDGQQLIVLDRIHANVVFLVGSLLYMPVSIWDVIVERRKQDMDLESSENDYHYYMDDDASKTLDLQVQQQDHWLYLVTLLLATLAYLLNGLLETKMSLDDYQREMERLLHLPPPPSSSPPSSPSHQQLQLQELPMQHGPPSPSPLLQDDLHGQPNKRVLLLSHLHFHLHLHDLHSPPVEISPRFKHDIINGGLFCIAAALEFAFSIVGRSKVLLSLSAHCYVANALLTIWLRRQDDVHPTTRTMNPSILLIHAGDWLFLVGATLDATGTWLELLGYLKEPAGLWLLSSVAWLTDSLLYLAADVINLKEEEALQEEHQQDYGEEGGGGGGVGRGNDDNDETVLDDKMTHHNHESTHELVDFRSNRVPIRPNRNDDATSHYQLQQENEDNQMTNVTTVLAVDTTNNINNIINPPLPSLMDRTEFDSGSLVTPYVAADDVNLV